jgi:hypothetical protein
LIDGSCEKASIGTQAFDENYFYFFTRHELL